MTDRSFMLRALRLAEKGRGHTRPNPVVGCVVVHEGKVLAEGFHPQAGRDHAEVDALRKLGFRAPGATLYVNLEPCSHWGRTPPCVDAIARAGVRRVVAGMIDPNPLVAGQGLAHLRASGIDVEVGLLGEECQRANEGFARYILTRRPFVTLKAATTLDGHIATRTGHSQWITSEAARAHVHRVRSEHDAILVGVGTALTDDPQLTVRRAGWKGAPRLRVVLDSHLRLSPAARVCDTSVAPTLVLTTAAASPDKVRALEARGVEVEVLAAADGKVEVGAALAALGARQIVHLLVEGGGEVAASFALGGWVDRYLVYLAPRLVGGRDAPGMLGGEGVSLLEQGPRLTFRQVRRLGPDLLIEAIPTRGGS